MRKNDRKSKPKPTGKPKPKSKSTKPKTKSKPIKPKPNEEEVTKVRKPRPEPRDRNLNPVLKESFQKAIKEYAKQDINRRPAKIVARTVELINQSDGGWREDKSKLLFMIALGLEPTPKSAGVPSVTLSDFVLENKKLREKRIKRFEAMRHWRSKFVSLVMPEEIDLTKDNETTEVMHEESKPLLSLTDVFKRLCKPRPRSPLKQLNHKRRTRSSHTKRERWSSNLVISINSDHLSYSNLLKRRNRKN